LTDATFVAAARARLDANAADKRARRDRKQALAAQVNDKSASVAARAAALDVLAGMDAADADAKHAAIVARLNSAIMAARVSGLSETDAHALVSAAYAAKVEVAK
jgi:hypothetical protein